MKIEYNTDNQELYKVHKDPPPVRRKKKKRKRVTMGAIYNTVSKQYETEWMPFKLARYEYETSYKNSGIYLVKYK